MNQIPNDAFFNLVEDEISNGRKVQFRIKGDSMSPLLRDNKDDIVLYPCVGDELSPMDIVLFRYKGKYLLHRIIRREGNRLYIQGDGSYIAKEECSIDDVIGKVQMIVRPSGKIISVNSWQWRWLSYIWLKIRIIRNLLLRILKS
ncbi:MAG: S26 family signal peptidase [Bacteroides sp.]|nr:S26 family signal peptidase [Bacteroides sp.]